MALTAAELIAYLRVDKSDFDKGMSGAESRMRKSDGQFRDWAKGMGRAAVDLTVAGATAVAGLGTSVFITGMNYNTLQQQSRAALETIMDGGVQANRQMDRLDEFASNSPFAKDVFIQAQQQLLGFGMEAENVIPTLSAIEDSVAAVGGSNEDIAEIASIFADIEGTGRITGETLRRLGIRGIDAATIIGDQMGKTGEAIREEITSGSLDAGEAVEALTTGMTERFGGAAANVKDTAVGASDRIRAAFRDIGSHLATPFVDPQGGGKAIEWANEFADVLRALQQHVPEFTDMMVSRFGGSFETVSLVLKDAKDAIDRFDVSNLASGLDAVSRYAPAIAGVSGALLTMTASNVPGLRNLAGALGPIPAALGAAALASPEMRDALGDLGGALEPLLPILGDLAGLAAGAFTVGIETAAGAIEFAAGLIRPLLEAFEGLPGPIKDATGVLVAFTAVRKLFPGMEQAVVRSIGGIRTNLGNMRTSVTGVVDGFQPWGGALKGATDSAGDFRAAVGLVSTEVGKTAVRGMRGAVNGVVSFLGGPWNIALMGAIAVLGYWANEQREAKARVDELKDSLDEQTGAFTESTESMIGNEVLQATSMETLEAMGLTLGDVTDAILNGGEAYDYVNGKIVAYGDELDENGVKLRDVQDQLVPLEQLIRDEAAAAEEATAAKQLEIEARKALRDELDEGARSYERYIDALAVMSDDTKTAEERTRGLMDALNELNGGQKTSEERARELAGQARSLADQFEAAETNSDGLRETLFNTEQGIISHTDEGDRLQETLRRMSENAHTAAREAAELAVQEDRAGEAAKDATAAAKPYTDELRDMAEQFGLTDDELEIMLESMALVPSDIAFLVTDGESISQTELEVRQLTAEINALPDGDTHITDNETSARVIGILEELGYEVRTLDNGEVEVTATGVDATIDDINRAAGTYYAEVRANFILSEGPSKGGRGGVPYAPGKAPRYHGGIDTFGMADGAVTGPSVMDVAQMVKPGDIRYAGDRSDVDEAWIPLDGSNRSVAILNEAIDRMPNYEPPGEGMAAGGITGNITPPTVDGVEGPDTSELTDTWQAAMDTLESSTAETFDQMASETGAAQQSMTSDVSTAGTTMRSEVAGAQRVMQSEVTGAQRVMRSEVTGAQQTMTADVARAQQLMSSDVSTAGSDMSSATTSTQRAMTAETATQLSARTRDSANQSSAMSADLSSNLAAMLSDTRSDTSSMRDTTRTNMGQMRDGADREITGMRVEAGREFGTMYSEGVDAAADLRDGVVNRMGDARSPFANRVNNLVSVMRDFSKALNDAYGDMGVRVGTPSSISAWTGAVLPGYTPGQDVHTFHSPTAGQLNLSGGEGIARPEVVRAMGTPEFMRLNAAARRGGVSAVRSLLRPPSQSFADGGVFDAFGADAKNIRDEYKPKLPDNWVRPVGENVMDEVVDGLISQLENMMEGSGWVRPTTGRVTSRYGAGRGAYPHSGMDIARSHGTPTVSPTFGIVRKTGWNIGPGRTGIGSLVEHAADMFTYYGHNPVGGLRVKPGDTLAPGDRIGAQGNTGRSTGAHLHWEVHRGGPWSDVNPHPFWEAAGGGGFGAAAGGAGGSDRWANVIQAALRLNGLPTTERYVNAWLRQVQTESGGNPRAVQQIRDINSIRGNHARGLLQVIPPTFSAYSLPGMGDIFNPLHNAAAGMNYAKNRYGVTGMLNAIGRGRGYRAGTLSATPGWHMVGEDGVELVKMGGGETVKNNRQTRQVLEGSRMTEREAEMIGKAVAKHTPPGGNLIMNGTTVRDTDELYRKGTTAFRRTYKHLSRTS